MWEISSGQPPFFNSEHNYDMAINIICGMRPKVIPETPSKYKELMELCWNADPTERPDVNYLIDEIHELRRLYHQNENNEQKINNDTYITTNFTNSSYTNSLVRRLSKIYFRRFT